jgi:hypothetical protein
VSSLFVAIFTLPWFYALVITNSAPLCKTAILRRKRSFLEEITYKRFNVKAKDETLMLHNKVYACPLFFCSCAAFIFLIVCKE